MHCFALLGIFVLICCVRAGLWQGEAGELAMAEPAAEGSQWCAQAICIPLWKRRCLHLRAGFKRFARHEEKELLLGLGLESLG